MHWRFESSHVHAKSNVVVFALRPRSSAEERRSSEPGRAGSIPVEDSHDRVADRLGAGLQPRLGGFDSCRGLAEEIIPCRFEL